MKFGSQNKFYQEFNLFVPLAVKGLAWSSHACTPAAPIVAVFVVSAAAASGLAAGVLHLE